MGEWQLMTTERVKAVMFDFDGTLSTLRAGWEEVMAPFMKESILGGKTLAPDQTAELEAEIASYIDRSTGMQTINQMTWLAEQVINKGWNAEVLNEWGYKAEFNRRLLLRIREQVDGLRAGKLERANYLMKGSIALLELLRRNGIDLYVASGTDHPDVLNEAEALGVRHFFKEIAGAPVGRTECSKTKVIHDLKAEKGFVGHELAIIGDGRVEISLAKENGALALGIASDEYKREGVNPVKERRLLAAGADRIAGDYSDLSLWAGWLGVDVDENEGD